MTQTSVCSRVPESLSECIEEASRSTGAFRSEIVRRALRYYISENPDDLEVLEADQLPTGVFGGTQLASRFEK